MTTLQDITSAFVKVKRPLFERTQNAGALLRMVQFRLTSEDKLSESDTEDLGTIVDLCAGSIQAGSGHWLNGRTSSAAFQRHTTNRQIRSLAVFCPLLAPAPFKKNWDVPPHDWEGFHGNPQLLRPRHLSAAVVDSPQIDFCARFARNPAIFSCRKKPKRFSDGIARAWSMIAKSSKRFNGNHGPQRSRI